MGGVIEYYSLSESLVPDYDSLAEKIRNIKPKAVLVMNFFGFCDTSKTVELIKSIDESIKVIEDFSHSIFSIDKCKNCLVDYYVASLRKSLPLPDGGIIITDNNISECIENTTTQFSLFRIRAEIELAKYRYSKDEVIRSNSKAIIKDCESIISNSKATIYSSSPEMMHRMNNVNYEIIKYARKYNYNHLYNIIKCNPHIKVLFSPSVNNLSPFSLPILVEERDKKQKILADNGIYAPVLWPLNDRQIMTCEISRFISDHILSIPIDQRYIYMRI
ncbi:MAG: hypothetical protein MJY89_00105 [Bacteroidales bacterium]|nr:hypothetical protein [Bacteroidales bacterium]